MKPLSKSLQIEMLEATVERLEEQLNAQYGDAEAAREELQRRSTALHMASTTTAGDAPLETILAKAAAFDSFLRGFDDGKDPAPIADEEREGL